MSVRQLRAVHKKSPRTAHKADCPGTQCRPSTFGVDWTFVRKKQKRESSTVFAGEDEEVEKAVEGRITDKTDEETAKRIREEAKDNLAFSKVPDYLIENNTFKLSGDPITPDEYMEDYYKRMSEEQAASEDAKEE